MRLLSARITTLLVGPETAPENILQLDKFRSLVKEVVASGELHATERILIDNLLAAGSTEVVEIMIPRTRVAFIADDCSVPEMVGQVISLEGHRITRLRAMAASHAKEAPPTETTESPPTLSERKAEANNEPTKQEGDQ